MRPPRPIIAFARSREGAILPIFGVLLAVMMGLVALSFDFGRLAATQSELQSFADTVALAAAGELDGRDDAITRATLAAGTMVSDTVTYGEGATTLQGGQSYTLTFLSQAPSPKNPNGVITTDGDEARFVRVQAQPRTVGFSFAAALQALGGDTITESTVAADAIAGFSLMACDVTPMMFCLPSPDWRAEDHVGSTILLRSGGQGAAWGPGDFGFLDPSAGQIDQNGVCAGLNGSNLNECLIGAVGNRLGCFDQRGVSLKPGQSVGSLEAALNMRFDIYEGSVTNRRNNRDYAPAPNVISGYKPAKGQCIGNNAVRAGTSVGLPVDDCFTTGACTRYGNGIWSTGRANDVSKNYGPNDPHLSASTRYKYYKAEIAAAGGPASNAPILKGNRESGRPK